MAIDRFFTGFEGGETSFLVNPDAACVILDNGKARTGQFCFHSNVHVALANTGRANAPTPTAGKAIVGGYATGNSKICFKILAYPSVSDVVLFGYGTVNGELQTTARLDTTGRVAVGNGLTIGPYNSSPLALNTWYKLVLHQVIEPNTTGSLEINSNVVVRAADDTIIAAVSNMGYTVANGIDFAPPIIGHADAIVSTYLIDFDDWISVIEDNGPAILPTADRVTRADATSIIDNIAGLPPTVWVGDYRAVTEIPFDLAGTDELVSSSSASQITFGHKSATELQITGVEAIKFTYQVRALDQGPQLLMVNITPVGISVPAVYGNPPAQYFYWQSMSDADFNTFKFGLRTETTTVRLGQMFLEVLHAGGNYWPNEIARTGTWQQKIIGYVGTGQFQSILGFGFKPQVIITKKVDGDPDPGMLKTSLMGGTRSKPHTSLSPIGRGILNILDDGFDIGPDPETNQIGIHYVAIAFKDGGYGTNCYFLDVGTVVGDNVGRLIPTNVPGTPQFVWISGEQTVFKGDDRPDNDSTPLFQESRTTNFIVSFQPNGFVIGSDNNMNQNNELIYYFAIMHSGYLFGGFYYGNIDAASSNTVVPAFGWQPDLVIAKQASINDAQWRYRNVHNNLDSSLWAWTTAALNTTGIIALPAGNAGFTLGASLSAAGINTRFIAFANSFNVSTGGNATVDAGPDQLVVFGSVVSLLGSGVEHSYPCSVVTFTWSQVSGPGTATFDTPNAAFTGVHFSAPGTYILRLTLNNGLPGGNYSDDVQIKVVCPNITSNAGPDQVINSTSTTLNGSAVGPTSFGWNQVSGPSDAVFANRNSFITQVSGLVPGVYTFVLIVANQCMVVSDTMTVTVLSDCVLPTPALDFGCS